MSLIECIECKASISDEATSCPQCGKRFSYTDNIEVWNAFVKACDSYRETNDPQFSEAWLDWDIKSFLLQTGWGLFYGIACPIILLIVLISEGPSPSADWKNNFVLWLSPLGLFFLCQYQYAAGLKKKEIAQIIYKKVKHQFDNKIK